MGTQCKQLINLLKRLINTEADYLSAVSPITADKYFENR
jgi:hypothetical protein